MTRSIKETEIWRARIDRRLADGLRADAAVLGLAGRADVVRTALQLLHRTAAEDQMARDVHGFYGDRTPPLPIGVRPAPVGEGGGRDPAG